MTGSGRRWSSTTMGSHIETLFNRRRSGDNIGDTTSPSPSPSPPPGNTPGPSSPPALQLPQNARPQTDNGEGPSTSPRQNDNGESPSTAVVSTVYESIIPEGDEDAPSQDGHELDDMIPLTSGLKAVDSLADTLQNPLSRPQSGVVPATKTKSGESSSAGAHQSLPVAPGTSGTPGTPKRPPKVHIIEPNASAAAGQQQAAQQDAEAQAATPQQEKLS